VGGFAGVVDEIGVYYRDSTGLPSPDADLYRRRMRSEHGDFLLYADGFDGTRTPAGVRLEGESRLRAGELLLDPGASVSFPSLELGDQVIEAQIVTRAVAGTPRWDAGTLVLPLEPAQAGSGQTRLVVELTANETIVAASGAKPPYRLPSARSAEGAGGARSVTIRLSSGGNAAVAVSSYVALTR
jgi:hypothetical protein